MLSKARPKKMLDYIKNKGIIKSSNLDHIDPGSIRVAVVQEKLMILKSYQAFIDRMEGFIKKAEKEGSQLIVFPEENGLLALGMLPFIERILKIVLSKEKDRSITGRSSSMGEGRSFDLAEIFEPITPFIKSLFETTFSELAKAYGLYMMAGSTMLAEEGKLYNRSYLFGPDGRVMGTQDKIHPIELEMKIGLSVANELKLYSTPIGKLAMPVCMDATYYETFKIARKLGAQIVIIPIANIEEYHYHLALRGIWPRVQESGVYGLKSALVGDLFGIGFTGKAGIYAPIILTPDQSGIVAEANSYDQDEVVCGYLDLSELADYDDPYFTDQNEQLYQKYLSQIYSNPTIPNY